MCRKLLLGGVQSPANPGAHIIVVQSADGSTIKKEVALAEGSAQTITIALSRRGTPVVPTSAEPAPVVPGASAVPFASPVPPASAALAPAPIAQTPATSGRQAASPLAMTTPLAAAEGRAVPRWVGFTALAVGGVGIAAGATFGLLASSKRDSSPLAGNCVESRCAPAVVNDANEYNRMRTLSMVGFGIGAVGAVSGAVLLLAFPSPRNRERPIAVDVISSRDTQRIALNLTF